MKNIIEAIKQDKHLRVCMYTVNSTSENRVKKILALYLKRHNCDMLLSPLYTVIKELLINAVKANYKNIYFEDYNPKNNATNLIDYHTALRLFKLEMTRENERNLVRLARKRDIRAEIRFRLEGEILNVIVTNPVPMTDTELENIRVKLEEARECEDISDYFLLHSDDPNTEGAGIGLVLISMILRSLGVDQSTLKIVSDETITRASLDIPLNGNTVYHYQKNTLSA